MVSIAWLIGLGNTCGPWSRHESRSEGPLNGSRNCYQIENSSQRQLITMALLDSIQGTKYFWPTVPTRL